MYESLSQFLKPTCFRLVLNLSLGCRAAVMFYCAVSYGNLLKPKELPCINPEDFNAQKGFVLLYVDDKIKDINENIKKASCYITASRHAVFCSVR